LLLTFVTPGVAMAAASASGIVFGASTVPVKLVTPPRV
jgi:hypothetical protein